MRHYRKASDDYTGSYYKLKEKLKILNRTLGAENKWLREMLRDVIRQLAIDTEEVLQQFPEIAKRIRRTK